MDRSHEYLDKIEEGIDRINASATRVKSVLRSKDDKIASLRAELNEAREAGANMRRQIDEANKTAEQFKTAAEQWKNRYWELRNTPPEQAPAPSISVDGIYFKKIADRLNNENRALRGVNGNRLAEIEHAETELTETKHELEATTARNARLEQRLEAIRKAGEFAQPPF